MTLIATSSVASPVGRLVLYAREETLCALVFDNHERETEALLRRRFGEVRFVPARDPAGAATRLADYLDGNLDALTNLPVDPGGTPFQNRVWTALRAIPVGATCSYRQLAAAVGAPTAMRAVGAANGRNPVSLVIPCHRVIASDGTLCGYAGGLARKEWLLGHERALLV